MWGFSNGRVPSTSWTAYWARPLGAAVGLCWCAARLASARARWSTNSPRVALAESYGGSATRVVPPRPLAPIFDIAAQVGGVLQAALTDPDRHRIISAFLGVLRADGGPWIAVLEDVQWADEVTLEVLRVVGRRAPQLRALVIATYRDDEVGPDHPLSVALGDIPVASMVSMSLPPLSLGAVELLGAHKASLAHYDNALKYAGRLAPAAKAPLLAAHAHECWLTDKATRAVASQEEAIANYREAGDPAEEGRAISDLAEYLWWNGESDRAYRAASRAVAIFESTQPDANVARAYARVARDLYDVRPV